MLLTPLHRRAQKVSKHYRALMVMLGGIPKEERVKLDEEIAGINARSKRDLNAIIDVRSRAIEELDEVVGLRAKADEYIKVVDDAMGNARDLYLIPKHVIDTQFFRNYGAFHKRWHLFPPHVRFGIDARGNVPFTGDTIEWRLLEAALFEDMAMLWNESVAHETNALGVVGEARIPGKRFGALKRSTARAVFALLEGYVNGIGVDIEWTMDVASMGKSEREAIREKDDAGRPQFKSLRAKLLQYPRIAKRAEHAPITESNEHLALVLKRERDWRDAVMHPTPKFEETREMGRERTFFEIELSELRDLVDAAIAMIRDVDRALDGQFGSVTVWIDDRQENGRFRNQVFF